jgi:hypothetical protein
MVVIPSSSFADTSRYGQPISWAFSSACSRDTFRWSWRSTLLPTRTICAFVWSVLGQGGQGRVTYGCPFDVFDEVVEDINPIEGRLRDEAEDEDEAVSCIDV